MSFSGKVALMVSAGRGFRHAIALTFAQQGADIEVADFEEAVAKETSRLVEQEGRKSLPIQVDVRNAEVESAVKKAFDGFGKIDVLVDCLSVATSAQLVNMAEDVWALHGTPTMCCFQ